MVREQKMELEAMMQRDYEQSRDSRENAIIGFNENSEALYHESERLIIDSLWYHGVHVYLYSHLT